MFHLPSILQLHAVLCWHVTYKIHLNFWLYSNFIKKSKRYEYFCWADFLSYVKVWSSFKTCFITLLFLYKKLVANKYETE